jgi:hypothetical protein
MPSLARILDHLAETRVQLMRDADRVPPESWRRNPQDGAWSAAEVIAHLTQVERRLVAAFEKQLERGPRPARLPVRIGVPLRLSGYRVVRRKTPIPLDPALLQEKETMLAALRDARQGTLELTAKHADKNLADYRWPHPFFGMLNGYEWLRFLSYHERRHGKQIQEIVDSVLK